MTCLVRRLSILLFVCPTASAQTSAVPPSPTVEAAKFSDHVYEVRMPPGASDGKGLIAPPKYKIIATANDPISGFQAAAYQHETTKHVTVAFRGTDDTADRVANQGLGRSEYRALRGVGGGFGEAVEDRQFNSQLEQAQQFTDRVRDKVRVSDPTAEIRLTGHSLGGALAQVEGARTGLKTATFNAPGMTNTINRLYPNARTDHIHNHVRERDLPALVSTQAGNIYRYPNRDADSVVIRDGTAVHEPTALWWQQQGYRHNHNMKGFYVDLLEGLTPADPQAQHGDASANSARRAALHNGVARQNDISTANRAAVAAGQAAGSESAYMNQMMLMLVPAAITASQQRPPQPPYVSSAPAPAVYSAPSATTANPMCFGYSPGCYNDGRKLDTPPYVTGGGSADSGPRRAGPSRPLPGHR